MRYKMNGKTAYAGADGTNPANKTRLAWIRRLSQIGMLFIIGEYSFYGIFRCPFAIPYVSCTSCSVIQCPGRWMVYPFWILLGISALFFGRGFCGWACPGGLVSGLLSGLLPIRQKIKNGIDRKLHLLKYLCLVICLSVWLLMSNPRLAIPIRIGEFWNSVILTFQHADNLWLARSIGLLILLVAGGGFGNLWCRHLCPTGGALETLKSIGIFRFRKSDDCNQCGLCAKKCEMNTKPEEYNCTNCGNCKNSCPSGTIYFGGSKLKLK
jgi:polyferredoxin